MHPCFEVIHLRVIRDIVYKTFYLEIPRVVFESFYGNLPVTSAAIDVWSIIQNNDEKLKNKVASRSVFCKTGMLVRKTRLL